MRNLLHMKYTCTPTCIMVLHTDTKHVLPIIKSLTQKKHVSKNNFYGSISKNRPQ